MSVEMRPPQAGMTVEWTAAVPNVLCRILRELRHHQGLELRHPSLHTALQRMCLLLAIFRLHCYAKCKMWPIDNYVLFAVSMGF